MTPPYYLGCPMWANRRWNGLFYKPKTQPKAFLRAYSGVFNSVEGNTSFYAVPQKVTLQKWFQNIPDDFRFCFKFPRTISHEKPLIEGIADACRFLEHCHVQRKNLGPFFLQLPERFDDLHGLRTFFEKMPAEFDFAVEVRNGCFFDQGPVERDFCQLLNQLEIDRVIFDSHVLMAHESTDPAVQAAKCKKPKTPVRFLAHGRNPMLRFVGNPQLAGNVNILSRWADVVAQWIREARTPYVFMHQVPEDDEAPIAAWYFHELLRMRLPDLNPLNKFPIDDFKTEPKEVQLNLF